MEVSRGEPSADLRGRGLDGPAARADVHRSGGRLPRAATQGRAGMRLAAPSVEQPGGLLY